VPYREEKDMKFIFNALLTLMLTLTLGVKIWLVETDFLNYKKDNDIRIEALQKRIFEMDHQLTKYVIPINATAYTSLEKCTDSTPFITASNELVTPDTVAVSWDIEQKYNLKFGDIIYFPNFGKKIFRDRMNKRIFNGMDLWMPNEKACIEFGRREMNIVIERQS
jgi:3D (Asp-Asp-Asp) domain-containing protein